MARAYNQGARQIKPSLVSDEGPNLPTATATSTSWHRKLKRSHQGDSNHACHGSYVRRKCQLQVLKTARRQTHPPFPAKDKKRPATILSETQISKHYRPHPSATPHPTRTPPACDDAGVPTLWKDRVSRGHAAEASRGASPTFVKEKPGDSLRRLFLFRELKGFQMQRFETHHKRSLAGTGGRNGVREGMATTRDGGRSGREELT